MALGWPDERRAGLRDLAPADVMVVGAPADAIAGLEHGYRLAVAAKLDRGSQPGEPSADDRDVDRSARAPALRGHDAGSTGERSPRGTRCR